MDGDPREAIEQDIETTCAAITGAAGYDLPEEFLLITRELLMWDQVNGRYPALILQTETVTRDFIELSLATEGRLSGRAMIYFKPISGEVPATTANRYLASIQRGLMQDPGRSGYADWTEIDQTPTAYIWRDTATGPVLEATTKFLVVYEYDPKAPAIVP